MKTKVMVGMSGGVDSSVAAMLLKSQGYDVMGVFIKTWQPDYIECTSRQDRLDAIRVCAQLDIPFVTLDLEKEYKEKVIDYLLYEYKNNRTPNPDVMCNKYIKFEAFLDFAESHQSAIATGHYAKIVDGELYAADDKNKDQSYFLYQIKKDNIKKLLFPLASLDKNEVRKIARDSSLYTRDKKDSQGICMLGGEIDIKEFLKRELRTNSGEVLLRQDDNSLEVVGSHDGTELYTTGERHGFYITTGKDNQQPLFVVDKDTETNILIVSKNNPITHNSHTENKTIKLKEVNILTSDLKELEAELLVRLRYRGELFEAVFNIETSELTILAAHKHNTQAAVASGQSAVMYSTKGKVLGGGIVF